MVDKEEYRKPCERCGKLIEKVSVKATSQKYCVVCAKEVQREIDREYRRNKRKNVMN